MTVALFDPRCRFGPTPWVLGAVGAGIVGGIAGVLTVAAARSARAAPGQGFGLLVLALTGVVVLSAGLAAAMAVGVATARRAEVRGPSATSIPLAVATGVCLVAGLAVRPEITVGFMVLAAIFVPLERWFALHRQRVFRAGWRTDVMHLVVNNLLTLVGIVIGVLTVGVALRFVTPDAVRSIIAEQPWWAQFGLAFLVSEIAGYWAHRASHAVPFLWRFHKVHHSIEEMDWLAAGHLHPLDQAFHRTCLVVPLFALGFSEATFGAYLALVSFQAIFIHANVRFRFGPLRRLIATPEFHHWHHAADVDAHDSNFAGQLPLLDQVFGTLHLPTRRHPGAYGISEPQPAGYLRQLAWPFRRRAVRVARVEPAPR